MEYSYGYDLRTCCGPNLVVHLLQNLCSRRPSSPQPLSTLQGKPSYPRCEPLDRATALMSYLKKPAAASLASRPQTRAKQARPWCKMYEYATRSSTAGYCGVQMMPQRDLRGGRGRVKRRRRGHFLSSSRWS